MKLLIAHNLEKIGKIATSLVAGIFIPAVDILIFAGFLIFADTFTGIWAAKTRGEAIHSSRMKQVLSKLIIYPTMIIFSSWAEYLLPEIPFLKGSSVLFVVVEGKSISENISDILGYDLINLIKAYIENGKKGMIEVMTKSKDARNRRTERNEDSCATCFRRGTRARILQLQQKHLVQLILYRNLHEL